MIMKIKAMIEAQVKQMEINQSWLKEERAEVPDTSYRYARLDLSIALSALGVEILKAMIGQSQKVERR